VPSPRPPVYPYGQNFPLKMDIAIPDDEAGRREE